MIVIGFWVAQKPRERPNVLSNQLDHEVADMQSLVRKIEIDRRSSHPTLKPIAELFERRRLSV
jgi:hypothetical protein